MNYDYKSKKVVYSSTNNLCMISRSNIKVNSEITLKFKSVPFSELNGEIYYYVYYNWITLDEFYVMVSDRNNTIFLTKCKNLDSAISYTKSFEVVLRKVYSSGCKIYPIDLSTFKYLLNQHDYMKEPDVIFRR